MCGIFDQSYVPRSGKNTKETEKKLKVVKVFISFVQRIISLDSLNFKYN